MGRESFIFYKSFFEAIRLQSKEIQADIYNAVLEYAFNGYETENISDMAKSIFLLIKPQIDANNQRYENGKKGGAPKGNKNAQKREKENQKITVGCFEKQPKNNQKQPNVNDNVNENVNVNDNKNTMRKAEALALFERLWKLYPNKKGKGQVSETQKKRLLTIGEPALVKAIERYKAALLQDGGWRKPQYGSTFFNSGYVDYLDENFEQYDQNSLSAGEAANFGEYESEWDRRVREAKERGETTPDIGPLDF